MNIFGYQVDVFLPNSFINLVMENILITLSPLLLAIGSFSDSLVNFSICNFSASSAFKSKLCTNIQEAYGPFCVHLNFRDCNLDNTCSRLFIKAAIASDFGGQYFLSLTQRFSPLRDHSGASLPYLTYPKPLVTKIMHTKFCQNGPELSEMSEI